MSTQTPRLTITCPVGHALGTLEAGPLELRPHLDRAAHLLASERRAMRELAAGVLAERADLEELAAVLVELAPEAEGNALAELADLEKQARALMAPRSSDLERTALILTPDGRALAWACLDCWRSGATTSTHRRPTRWHHGRAPLRPFLALLLAQSEPLAIVGTETRTRRALADLPAPNLADLDALAAEAHNLPAPTPDEYRSWAVSHLIAPSGKAARERFAARYLRS